MVKFSDFSNEITEEMIDWFNVRTKKHIDLVNQYCEKIYQTDQKRFADILHRGNDHDASKYGPIERIPYIFISWKYRCLDTKQEFKISPNITAAMHRASEHHVKANRHHPEYFDQDNISVINKTNRDLPLEEIINATKMTDLDIAEMVADWCAMSKERNESTPKNWADKNINIRWSFDLPQIKLIYSLIDEIWT